MNKKVKVCNRCIMDETAENIFFDEADNCNFCNDYINKLNKSIYMSKDRDIELNKILTKIKEDGKNKEYDCIMGVSGGLDSSYLLLKAVEFGLRPLAVHLDNGWNSELAVKNIDNLVKKLDVDLYTHVINWEEFKGLQKAFFNADVIDIELLTDHAIISIMYKLANKYNIKYMLPGTNISNEGMDMPENWNHFKWDITNIKDIYNKFGAKKSLKTYPSMSVLKYFYYSKVRKIEWVSLLDYMDFDKNTSLKILKEKVDYVPYEKKHYESVFTRFYQGYILPNKFNIDKRKLHYSTLICSGQISKEEVLIQMKNNPYDNKTQLEEDKEFVLKKLSFTEVEFEDYMKRPGKLHSEYASNIWVLDFYKKFIKRND